MRWYHGGQILLCGNQTTHTHTTTTKAQRNFSMNVCIISILWDSPFHKTEVWQEGQPLHRAKNDSQCVALDKRITRSWESWLWMWIDRVALQVWNWKLKTKGGQAACWPAGEGNFELKIQTFRIWDFTLKAGLAIQWWREFPRQAVPAAESSIKVSVSRLPPSSLHSMQCNVLYSNVMHSCKVMHCYILLDRILQSMYLSTTFTSFLLCKGRLQKPQSQIPPWRGIVPTLRALREGLL